jgi:predicted MPP superfamily phosphohydrolase
MEAHIEPGVRTAVHYVQLLVRTILTWILRISLPLVFANALLRAFPYRATVAGVPFHVQATLFTHTGFSADTTVGSWEFPHVDGLPVGIHLSPVDVDVLRLSKVANPDTTGFAEQLKDGFAHQIPYIAAWLIGLTLLGIGLGLLVAAALNMALRYLKGLPRRERELRLRARQLAAAAVVTVVVAGYGVYSFNSDWTKQSRLTGTLGAVQLFPSQLEQFYNQQAKAYNVLGAVVGIQAALQARIDASNTPDTAFNILYISDMHLAAEYPLVLQYVKNFQVKLIVNTGDESEFGTAAELTEGYLSELRSVTAVAPMLWLAGNHDSPDTIDVIRRVPGVTVLGTKSRQADGSYEVQGSRVRAFGLGIGGLPDPRVYGAAGVYGSDVDKVTDQLEQRSVDSALAHASSDTYFDIFATHEPAAAAELADKLSGRIRQTNSGHTHAQNATGQIQQKGRIDLIEGSTGAGGLDNINRKSAPPVEFSIESVSGDCQFTKLLRFQLADPALPTDASAVSVGDNVTVSTTYLGPQKISATRVCSVAEGIGPVKTLDAPQDVATDVQR